MATLRECEGIMGYNAFQIIGEKLKTSTLFMPQINDGNSYEMLEITRSCGAVFAGIGKRLPMRPAVSGNEPADSRDSLTPGVIRQLTKCRKWSLPLF